MKSALNLAIAVVLVLALVGVLFYQRYLTDAPADYYADPIEHFKYGSYGSEKTGLPYPVWKALPEVCKSMLAGGWADLGFRTEPGKDIPIGVSIRKYGLPLVGLNCAACHAGVLEGSPDQPAQLVPGMPNPRFDAQGYSRFVLNCVSSDAFTDDNVLRAIDTVGVSLPFYDRVIYRVRVLGKIRELAQGSKKELAWMDSRPAQGPGRTDTANLFRMQLKQNPGGDNIPGTVDFPSLWNQGPRAKDGGGQHWDGDNDSFRERNYTSALASGATEESLDSAAVDRVSDWITDLPAPKYPYAIDAAKAAQGQQLWLREKCHDCHDFGGASAGKVLPLALIGTDPGRVQAFTAATADAFKTLGVGKPWHITHYRKTNGYLNVWTDGIWARSPYLHNGSVPTLYDLLLPPEQRPKEFFRGCSVLDPKHVGWQCSQGFRFQTSLPGNGNSGHTYGTALSDDERWALVEYMKAL
jgi:mono/diheme cytochrome c family protein